MKKILALILVMLLLLSLVACSTDGVNTQDSSIGWTDVQQNANGNQHSGLDMMIAQINLAFALRGFTTSEEKLEDEWDVARDFGLTNVSSFKGRYHTTECSTVEIFYFQFNTKADAQNGFGTMIEDAKESWDIEILSSENGKKAMADDSDWDDGAVLVVSQVGNIVIAAIQEGDRYDNEGNDISTAVLEILESVGY